MHFLRNKDAKVLLLLYIIIAVVMCIIGFNINMGAGVVAVIASLAFMIASLWADKKRYMKITRLSDTIDMILHSDTFIALEDVQEGDFAVLESEIQKMTVKIREGAYLLQKEKIYLIDSIADISHQLRTPLTTINLLMSFLQDKDLSYADRMKYVTEIQSHLRRIDWLISSLLKISKLDAGTVVMKKEKTPVADLVAKAAESIMISLEIREQLFDYTALGNEAFTGDMNWSIEAISNIIKNCMEHTPKGGHISVKASENILYTRIVIEDSGAGISSDDLPHIFERFYRGKDSSDSSVGIGLALSRMIIQNQNGSIKAENRKEGGSRFIIKFYKGEGKIDGDTESRKSQ